MNRSPTSYIQYGNIPIGDPHTPHPPHPSACPPVPLRHPPSNVARMFFILIIHLSTTSCQTNSKCFLNCMTSWMIPPSQLIKKRITPHRIYIYIYNIYIYIYYIYINMYYIYTAVIYCPSYLD